MASPGNTPDNPERMIDVVTTFRFKVPEANFEHFIRTVGSLATPPIDLEVKDDGTGQTMLFEFAPTPFEPGVISLVEANFVKQQYINDPIQNTVPSRMFRRILEEAPADKRRIGKDREDTVVELQTVIDACRELLFSPTPLAATRVKEKEFVGILLRYAEAKQKLEAEGSDT